MFRDVYIDTNRTLSECKDAATWGFYVEQKNTRPRKWDTYGWMRLPGGKNMTYRDALKKKLCLEVDNPGKVYRIVHESSYRTFERTIITDTQTAADAHLANDPEATI